LEIIKIDSRIREILLIEEIIYHKILWKIKIHQIKYSAKNIDVKVKTYKKNGKIIISVEDKGIGIDDLEKGSVFQKFYRSKHAEKLGIKGFGLGLSLVKSIVDEASGRIEIIDNKPNGTIFKITLPAVDLED